MPFASPEGDRLHPELLVSLSPTFACIEVPFCSVQIMNGWVFGQISWWVDPWLGNENNLFFYKLHTTNYSMGSKESVEYLQLEVAFEHDLGIGSLGTSGQHWSSYNMCVGPFGGIRGKDCICVQAMDGRLSFFEGNRAAFTISLPDILIPGPMCYIAKLDSIVTSNSRFDVVCYNYQHLASVAASAPSAKVSTGSAPSSGKEKVRVYSQLCFVHLREDHNQFYLDTLSSYLCHAR